MKALKGFYVAYGALMIVWLLIEFFRLVMAGKDLGATFMAIIAVWIVFVILRVLAMRILVRLL